VKRQTILGVTEKVREIQTALEDVARLLDTEDIHRYDFLALDRALRIAEREMLALLRHLQVMLSGTDTSSRSPHKN
jgi:hypothetical protein